MSKKIFTFWEPKENIPPYIQLCMNTWKKFLPEYEIIILDYSNLSQWIGKDFFDKTLYKNYSLPKQADAIRCAVLEKHGGIWFDTDTIITSENVRDYLNINSQFILVGKHIAFIKSSQHSCVSQEWLLGIKQNIKIHKKFLGNVLIKRITKTFNKKLYNRLENWDYLGNSILDKVIENKTAKDFYSIDKVKNCILPEIVCFPDEQPYDAYNKFYFENDYSDFVRKTSKGLVLLHNSWTPLNFKNMSKEEFLRQDNTLSKLFNFLLQ